MEGERSSKVTLPCGSCGRLNRVDLGRAGDRPKCGSCSAALAVDRPVPVTDQTLDRVLQDAEAPVLVDFYADWCGPCKIMSPVLDALARERLGQVLIAKLDTDRNPSMSARYAVRGIPTLIAFQRGREVAREVGAVPRPRLDALIDAARAAGAR